MRHRTTLTARKTAFLALAAVCATACGSPRTDEAATGRAVEAPSEARRDQNAPVTAEPAQSAGIASAAPVARSESHVAEPQAPGSQVTGSKVADPQVDTSVAPALAAFDILVPGTTAKLALAPIPAGAIHVADGSTPTVGPFFASTTEITWDMYDAFVFAMERAETEKDPPDAFARPSKPYILMDRGFGHAGYPVISVSFRGATEFCRWLSARTGRRFRLPTEIEWQHAGGAFPTAGISGYAWKPSVPTGSDALAKVAWFQENSKKRGRITTKPVGTKESNGYGLFDVQGNAAEWTVAPDGTGVLHGGSFLDPAEKLSLEARLPDDPAFNATDPQIPKSVWWLADGPFAGFRVVCDP